MTPLTAGLTRKEYVKSFVAAGVETNNPRGVAASTLQLLLPNTCVGACEDGCGLGCGLGCGCVDGCGDARTRGAGGELVNDESEQSNNDAKQQQSPTSVTLLLLLLLMLLLLLLLLLLLALILLSLKTEPSAETTA
jgi:hypothetical protein